MTTLLGTLRTGAAALLLAAAASILGSGPAGAQVGSGERGLPEVVVDLRNPEAASVVQARWRYRPAEVAEATNRDPGPDLRPSGAPNRTLDIVPRPGTMAFDGAGWEDVSPGSLEGRRTKGKLAFGWYRVSLTIPARLAGVDPTGMTAVLEVVVDDYAEVWVDGALPVVLGQRAGRLVGGFNTPNRVVLTRNAQPGQSFDVAVFAANAPLSAPPENFVWIRSATVDFFSSAEASVAEPVEVVVDRVDPRVDKIVDAEPRLEKLATGFRFTEGPVWIEDAGGYLLFSDPNANRIYRWSPEGEVSVYRTKSGYAGLDIGAYRQPGSNGLALDPEGRLTIAEHGNRRVTRLERNGSITVLADRYEGGRLNSPNDLVWGRDGALYFTDPPFGLPAFGEDPRKELKHNGVYRLADGELRLLTDELQGPNGIALSPDGRTLYVGDWDPAHKVVMRYALGPDGSIRSSSVLADLTAEEGEDAIDGVKVDVVGNVYVSGPGGLWIYSPEGDRLGRIAGPEHAHNMAWGDADGRTLYLAAQTGLYRMRMKIPGLRMTPNADVAAAAPRR